VPVFVRVLRWLAGRAEGEGFRGAEPGAVSVAFAEGGADFFQDLVAGGDDTAGGLGVAGDGLREVFEPGVDATGDAGVAGGGAEVGGRGVGAGVVETGDAVDGGCRLAEGGEGVCGCGIDGGEDVERVDGGGELQPEGAKDALRRFVREEAGAELVLLQPSQAVVERERVAGLPAELHGGAGGLLEEAMEGLVRDDAEDDGGVAARDARTLHNGAVLREFVAVLGGEATGSGLVEGEPVAEGAGGGEVVHAVWRVNEDEADAVLDRCPRRSGEEGGAPLARLLQQGVRGAGLH